MERTMSQTRSFGLPAAATVMAALLLGSNGWAREALAQSDTPASFPVASVHFEQNATDGDVEVVFQAAGETDGLASLKVVSPEGRTVIDFTAPDPSTLGMRSFRIESPEPQDVDALKAAYPEGAYEFTGRTSSGAALVGKSTLSHTLPAAAEFGVPAPEAKNVPTEDVEISWSTGDGVAFYIVEIEQEELGTRVEATLPSSLTVFAVPNGFLMPGKEYHLGIGTVTGEGNVSFVETSFTTKE
jgi:hypothetical protein